MEGHDGEVRVLEGEAADVHVERRLGCAVRGRVAVAAGADGAHRRRDEDDADMRGAVDLLGSVHALGVLQLHVLGVLGAVAARVLVHLHSLHLAAAGGLGCVESRDEGVGEEDGCEAVGVEDVEGLGAVEVGDGGGGVGLDGSGVENKEIDMGDLGVVQLHEELREGGGNRLVERADHEAITVLFLEFVKSSSLGRVTGSSDNDDVSRKKREIIAASQDLLYKPKAKAAVGTSDQSKVFRG